MKHLALLAAIYALVVALALPGSIFAQDESAAPEPTETTAAEPAPPEQAPAEPAPAQSGPAEPAPAPAETAAAPPEPQVLADEPDDAQPAKPKAIAAASGGVTIADFSFAPATITVSQGDTVTWTNNGPTPHSATASNGSFDTGILPKGESGSHTFDEAGTFSYFCQPHPYMKGTVVVQAAQTGGSDDGSDTTGSGTAGAEAEQTAGDGPTLPNTGSDSGALMLLGGLMLLLGAAVHRRADAG